MQISTGQSRIFISHLLSFLESRGITSTDDLGELVGETTGIGEKPKRTVAVEYRPSNQGTRALTLSYIVEDLGIPVQVKVNCALSYSQVIFKAASVFDGCEPFLSRDRYGNIYQAQVIPSAHFQEVRQALEELAQS